ncbi:hypothetical protein BOTNAR_0675g00050 [Botryotinia narcissicola]|uniref:Major facilitator superfamily (MFS) profile domain-containing protein n=1 Tax=Botryotinia narcissicola TaxID=278944 RepID=A0A4Z1H937_9HELO|nr:hypothetical protein BOTNAR_0675g00050 [Botryotinia narcissicola]
MRAEVIPHQAAGSSAHNSDQITDHEGSSIATAVGVAEFRDETPPRKSDEKLPVDAGRIADKIEVKVQLEEQALIDSTLEGWRFQFVDLAMCLSLCLSQLEATIVSTSLVSIASSLRAFNKSSWVVSVYLLTYTWFLITIAKLSDIFGRKNFIALVLGRSIAFSIGCGFSNDMTTLGPAGGVALALVFLAMPSNFPNHRKESSRKIGTVLTVGNLKRIDVIGLLLLPGASILLVTALEEGGTRCSWHSVITLSLLIISLVL